MMQIIASIDWFKLVFWVFAFVASLFYGLYACDIFGPPSTGQKWVWRLHAFWFNFAGSAVGWTATWFLALKISPCLSAPCLGSVKLSDGFLGFVAFVGITGFLPRVTFGLVQGITALASKLLEVVK